ncbi:hypothetical protein J2X08_001368 [Rhizobium rosettiformans]|nr:hypothetical protein [Rhizobium rosettiformans]MDR7063883.1 hypothetical protein [Rhizobium rosettiformans]
MNTLNRGCHPLTIDLNWRITPAMIDIRANITCTYFWAYR